MEAFLRVRAPVAATCSLALPLRRYTGLACRAARPDSPASTSSASSAGQGQQKAAAEPARPLQAGLKVLMMQFLAAQVDRPAGEAHASCGGILFFLYPEARHAGMLQHAGALAGMHALQNKRDIVGLRQGSVTCSWSGWSGWARRRGRV